MITIASTSSPPAALINSQSYTKDRARNSINKDTNYLTNNIIIVDIGSTGTRFHAYNIQKTLNSNKNPIPYIMEIATVSSNDKHAIADYDNNLENLTTHLKPLYNNLAKQLGDLELDIRNIPIYFYATAGMRLHDLKHQNQIYQEIIRIITQMGHNTTLMEAKTISGELEGIFDWLSVNYKLKTIQNNQTTVSALDMGGASTQVALEYPKQYHQNSKPRNLYKIKFGLKEYNIFSKSILGYGLTQTKKKISNYDTKQAIVHCNLHYHQTDQHKSPLQLHDQYHHNIGNDLNDTKQSNNIIQDFNFTNCSNFIKTYLKNKKEHLEIAKIIKKSIKNNMKFIAASGYYYNFKFFNSKQPEDLIKSIPDSCHSNRKEFIKKFPNLTEEELNESCFDATYLKILLNNAYNIPEGYPNFTIPKHDIDWTLGAALYITTNQSI